MIPGIVAAQANAGSGGSGFAAEVLADSPWAWWKLDDGASDSSAADASGNARHLTTIGIGAGNRQEPPLIADGGFSMLFAGDSISGSLSGFSGHNALSFECIVKPTSLAAAIVILHNGNLGIGGQQGQFLAINTSGGIYFQVFAGGAYRTRSSDNSSIAANESAIIGVSHDPAADQVVIYKNGVAIKTLAHTEGLADTANAAWQIGNLTGADAPFAGYLDHTIAYNAVLPAARFLAHAQAAGFA